MLSIGLTGGFGSGKSTVLGLFRKHGAYTADSDQIVHSILNRPATVKKIISLLGDSVLKERGKDIALDRKRIADIIFSDPRKRISMEKIIHPMVMREIQALKKEISKKDPSATVIVEVPLLFESGYEKNFDKVIAVFCKRDVAIRRLMKKDFSREEVLKRMRAQMPASKKKALADFVINNNNSIKKTEAQAIFILNKKTSS